MTGAAEVGVNSNTRWNNSEFHKGAFARPGHCANLSQNAHKICAKSQACRSCAQREAISRGGCNPNMEVSHRISFGFFSPSLAHSQSAGHDLGSRASMGTAHTHTHTDTHPCDGFSKVDC